MSTLSNVVVRSARRTALADEPQARTGNDFPERLEGLMVAEAGLEPATYGL
jgi:hypothetical protein